MTVDTQEQANSIRKARSLASQVVRHESFVLSVVLIGLTSVMSVLTQGATTSRVNLLNVLVQSSVRGFASIGQAFVVITAGIDVSVGGVGLFSSILGTSLLTSIVDRNLVGGPIPLMVGVTIMLVSALGWGMFNGVMVSRAYIPPLIATLGIWQITRGAAFNLVKGVTIHKLPDGLAFFGQGEIGDIPVPIILFIVIAVIAYLVLNHTRFGRNIYAVGGNPASAWLSGINVHHVLFAAYAISGLLAGVASVVWAGRIMSSSMDSLTGLEIDSISAVFVGGISVSGGKGNLIGVVIGVIIIGIINNGMSLLGANTAVQGISKGLIIIIAVVIDYLRRR